MHIRAYQSAGHCTRADSWQRLPRSGSPRRAVQACRSSASTGQVQGHRSAPQAYLLELTVSCHMRHQARHCSAAQGLVGLRCSHDACPTVQDELPSCLLFHAMLPSWVDRCLQWVMRPVFVSNRPLHQLGFTTGAGPVTTVWCLCGKHECVVRLCLTEQLEQRDAASAHSASLTSTAASPVTAASSSPAELSLRFCGRTHCLPVASSPGSATSWPPAR